MLTNCYLSQQAIKRGFIFAWNDRYSYIWTQHGETIYKNEDRIKIDLWFKFYDKLI